MYDHVKDATPLDSGFCFLCHPLCFSIFDKLTRQRERNCAPCGFHFCICFISSKRIVSFKLNFVALIQVSKKHFDVPTRKTFKTFAHAQIAFIHY